MSSAHLETFGSLKNAAETTATTLSSPTGWSVAETELETALTIVSGFQPMSFSFRSACATNLGVAALINASAPEALRLTISESTVGVGDFIAGDKKLFSSRCF